MLKRGLAILLLVRLGAIALTLTLGAHSAARDFVNPSTAPLAADITEWFGKPWPVATVENKTTELPGF